MMMMGDMVGLVGTVAGLNLEELETEDEFIRIRIFNGFVYKRYLHDCSYQTLGKVDMLTKEQCSLTAVFDWRKGHRLWPFHFHRGKLSLDEILKEHSLFDKRGSHHHCLCVKEDGKWIHYTDRVMTVRDTTALLRDNVTIKPYRYSKMTPDRPVELDYFQKLLKRELIKLYSLRDIQSFITNRTHSNNHHVYALPRES